MTICERTAARKRKPFDSAKQRIQGTELADFLPKQPQPAGQSGSLEGRRPAHAEERASGTRRPNVAWRQSRDEFLRAIRAARGDSVSIDFRLSSSRMWDRLLWWRSVGWLA